VQDEDGQNINMKSKFFSDMRIQLPTYFCTRCLGLKMYYDLEGHDIITWAVLGGSNCEAVVQETDGRNLQFITMETYRAYRLRQASSYVLFIKQ
jgi:hypothetical protein